VLEPAAPGLSEAIQRAIAAAEAPANGKPASATQTRPAPLVLDPSLQPSPWGSFMQAPAPPPVQRPPAQTPPAPRAAPRPPAPPPSPSPSPSVQRAIAEAEAPVQQPVDLYSALIAEGMVPPPAEPVQPPALPSRAAPPAPQPPATPPAATPPSASPPPVQRKPAGPNAAVPDPGTVEAAMLELLRLPPDTAVYGLKKPAEPAPSPFVSAPAPSTGAPPVQTKRLDDALADSGSDDSGFVQRVVEIGEVSHSVEGEGGGQAGEPDVEELARKVYRVLKDRLRTERERSSR
jgi:hypothetical protein